MQTAVVTGVPGTWIPTCHKPCWHNEVAALLKRSLGPTPFAAEQARGPVLEAFGLLRRAACKYGATRWGYLETAQSYKGSLRRRYLQAHQSLIDDGPLVARDYLLKAFVKAEKWEAWKVAKPRMIFPRSPRYNLCLASWLKPFEHWFWGNLKSAVLGGVGNSRVVAKGLNQVQRANLIRRKMRGFGSAVVFEVDGKAFEAHCDVWQLVQEHSVYYSAYPRARELKELLDKQLHNKGVSQCGVKFSRLGGRASGDVNTGMGNTLIMLAVVTGVMRTTGVQWDVLVDGDNALLFLERSSLDRVVEVFAPTALRISGHEMVLERPVTVVEEVRFGRSAPVKTARGWKMVCDYLRVLSHRSSSHIYLREPAYAREFLLGVALCESVLADGVPVLWAYANHLRRCTDTGSAPRLHGLGDYEVLGVQLDRLGSWASPPDEESRASFCRAFGVEPEAQRELERMVEGTKVRYLGSAPLDASEWYGFPFE
jgi:hypothetical protein